MTESYLGDVFGPTSGSRSASFGVGWGRIVKEPGARGAGERLERVADTRDVLSSALIRALAGAHGALSPRGRRRSVSAHRRRANSGRLSAHSAHEARVARGPARTFDPHRPPARRCLSTRHMCQEILSLGTYAVLNSREATLAKVVTNSRAPAMRRVAPHEFPTRRRDAAFCIEYMYMSGAVARASGRFHR